MSRFAIIDTDLDLTVAAVTSDATPESAAVQHGDLLVGPGPFNSYEDAYDALLARPEEEREARSEKRVNLDSNHRDPMWHSRWCVACLACTLVLGATMQADAQTPVVAVVELQDQAITPGTQRYVLRALDSAEQDNVECIVIVLDTPGGLLTSTRRIVKRILGSRIPVVVFVSPAGSRAASAGVFITLSSHVAAMAPGTTIGAAHPVQVGGLPIGPQSPGDATKPTSEDSKESDSATGSILEEKIINDTVAWAQALANRHDRNADWAAEAVTKSSSLTAKEAEQKGVVDLLANDLYDLLEQIDGREVRLADGMTTLDTSGATVQHIPMWWGEQLLATIASPNIAFLLMIFGFYGILFELYSPGWGVAGTLGVICMLLAFFGLAVLPVNYLGLALIIVGLVLLAAEAFVTSFGTLAIAGTFCLVAGGVMLVDSPAGFQRVSLSVVVPVAAATAAITLFLVSGIVRAHSSQVLTGVEALIGQLAVATGDFAPQGDNFTGMVAIHGERWRAISAEQVKQKQACEVQETEGLTLTVRPRSDATTVSPPEES